MKLIGLVLRGARYKDEILEVGDLAIHGEEAFPAETLAERVGAFAMAGEASAKRASQARRPRRNRRDRVRTGIAGSRLDTNGTTRRHAE